MVVPVIMAVKDRPELTKQTVDTLFRTTDPSMFRLIIVSDCSSQETNDYLKTLEDRAKVVYMEKPTCAPACKNAGMAIAGDSEYYYLTDNDMYFCEGWLDKLLKIMELFPSVGIVGGKGHDYHGAISLQEDSGVKIKTTLQQPGFSMLIRKKVWLDYGPFIHFERTELGRDDVRFCDLARNGGWEIAQPIEPVVFHCGMKNTFNTDPAGAEAERQQQFLVDAIVR